jgi:hypothetical protein
MRSPLRLPSFGRLASCISLLGLFVLTYLGGAATMYFQFPTADYLDKAFAGTKAWYERGRPSDASSLSGAAQPQGVTVDKREQTCDGFTLYTTDRGCRATLLNMTGQTVHQWELPFNRVWPHPSHVHGASREELIHWFRCHPYANGDLLAIYHAEGDTPYGYGLVKMDKDSKLLWAYAGNAHHDLDVAEDGTIYTLTHKLESKQSAGLEYLPSPHIADAVVVLSPEGRELHNVPILEAFRDSPYAPMLTAILNSATNVGRPHFAPPPGAPRMVPIDFSKGPGTIPAPPPPPPAAPTAPAPAPTESKGDLVHANSIKVLRPSLGAKFPLFKPGQVLISLRNLDTIAVLDISTRSIVWATRGIWHLQHDAEFLRDGRLLVFDNSGAIKGCRVVEYDPRTQAFPWVYANENTTPFSALFRGMKQRLPNGNTLIVDPDHGRLLEVTRGKALVWECFLSPNITGAKRYRADELTFLKEAAQVRP